MAEKPRSIRTLKRENEELKRQIESSGGTP